MSVKSVMVLGNQPTPTALATANTERGPSEIIWGSVGSPNAWVEDFLQDFRLGMYFEEDFNPAPNFAGGSFTGGLGKWALFSTANGTLADDAIVGGGLRLKASTTAQQGLTLGSTTGVYQLITAAGLKQGKLAFECRVSVSTGSFANSTQDTFIGLMDNLPPASQVPITNTPGTLATLTNFIGFHKRGGTVNANDWNFVFGANGQTIQYPTNMQAIVNAAKGAVPLVNTYYKLGFIYDPSPALIPQTVTAVGSSNQTVGTAARPIIRVFVDGVPLGTFLIPADVTGATFPSGVMAQVISFMQQSTTGGIFSAVDWIRVAQMAIN